MREIKKHIIYLIIIFIADTAVSQNIPADTLINNEKVSIPRKILICPITLWQKLSYSVPALNCQFEPSCSQFMALSISRHGIIGGPIIGADRIIRCNRFAHHYHTILDSGNFHSDGRLFDNIPDKIEFHKPDMSTTLSIIPGLGRLKNGRPGDGLYSFLLEASLGLCSYSLHQKGHSIGAVIFGTGAVVFWLSDFYDSMSIKKRNFSSPHK